MLEPAKFVPIIPAIREELLKVLVARDDLDLQVLLCQRCQKEQDYGIF